MVRILYFLEFGSFNPSNCRSRKQQLGVGTHIMPSLHAFPEHNRYCVYRV